MGGGLSSSMDTKPLNQGVSSVTNDRTVNAYNNPVKIENKKRKNNQIFDGGPADNENEDDEFLKGPTDENIKKLIAGALSGFFFIESEEEADLNPKVQRVIKGMEKEDKEKGELLIIEGESGSKLFVVESGELQVSINGEVIRSMSRGAMCGEIALLYDAPRSATVKCTSNCVLWSLRREIFKRIQATAATAHEIERSRLLINCPDLAVLSPIDLSRLVGSLESKHVSANEKIYIEKSPTTTVILIEKGTAKVYTTKNYDNVSRDDIDKSLCIFRPRQNDQKTNRGPMSRAPSVQTYEDICHDVPNTQTFCCDVGPGCIIGIGALRSRANLPDCWKWITSPEPLTKESNRGRNSHSHADGAECPFTMMSNEPCHFQFFTIEGFENLIGPVKKILRSGAAGDKGSPLNSNQGNQQPRKSRELVFDSTKFKMKCVLGTGSFGVVLMAEYRRDDDCVTNYALKCLSKVAVVDTGQLRHVLDERKILALMDCRFVLKLYGVYQTPHQLVMVTEALEYGDLWGIIYETAPYCDQGSLDRSLAIFYTASLILALDHIHRAGVVFRDLKPENILLDSNGYIRVIDFGFAKKVPYSKTDSNGTEKIYSKTYTLCGTPEYLSPELIFNLGHDQASDLWALGVLIHEMFMSLTPFVPTRADNVTELFTNIALVKKNGLHLDDALQQRGGIEVTGLITQLLSPEPSQRYGTQGGLPGNLLQHGFFADFDSDALAKGSLSPEFLPDILLERDPVSSSAQVKPFNGDQRLFAEFSL